MSDYIIENTLAAVEEGEGGITESAAALVSKHPMLGCNRFTAYSYYVYDVCDGWGCRYNNQCASDCCNSYVCSNSYCNADLAWLWWTLGSLFFVLCIISMMAGARRRRRQAMLLATIHQNNRSDSNQPTTVTTTYVQ